MNSRVTSHDNRHVQSHSLVGKVKVDRSSVGETQLSVWEVYITRLVLQEVTAQNGLVSQLAQDKEAMLNGERAQMKCDCSPTLGSQLGAVGS